MPVVLLERDPFAEASPATANLAAAQDNVRRPFYGISIKNPRFSFLQIQQLNSEGQLIPISMHDSSAPGGYSQANHNFILQQVTEQRQEKFQIVETFGQHFTFFFDERPVVLQCAGFLINTADFNWKNEWLQNYDHFLRGTRCVENRARAYLGFDDVLVEGFLLTTNVNYDKDLPYLCPFSFQLLVTRQWDLSKSDSTNYVVEAENARTVGGAESTTVVEYIGEVSAHAKFVVDPFTGESVLETGYSEYAPASLNDSGGNSRTAFWVTDRDPPRKQWKSEDEALVALNVNLAAVEQDSDVVTARQRLKDNASRFPLGTRSRAVELVRNSLIASGGNSVAVIEETPTLTSTPFEGA